MEGSGRNVSDGRGPVTLRIEGLGVVTVPAQFSEIVPGSDRVSYMPLRSERADEVFGMLRDGWLLVGAGDYADLKANMWYVMRFRNRLLPPIDRSSDLMKHRERERRLTKMVHRLTVAIDSRGMVGVRNAPPETARLEGWLGWNIDPGHTYLLPLRRLSRILTDMRRAEEGIHIRALGERITIKPHVYVPFDQSLTDMVWKHVDIGPTDTVLDMGTGTGVLALIAARKGAERVVATDISANSVANARENAAKLDLEPRVDVRGPGDLFQPVGDESFDVIIFNPPWIPGRPRNEYERSIYDPGQSILLRFLDQVKGHLEEGGRLYLLYSDASEVAREGSLGNLELSLERNGLRVTGDARTSRRSRLTGSREVVHLFEIRRK